MVLIPVFEGVAVGVFFTVIVGIMERVVVTVAVGDVVWSGEF